MIRILDDMPAGVLGVELTGQVTKADYTTILEPALRHHDGRLRVVLDIPEGWGGMEAGAVWQDLKIGVAEWTSWERLAVITDVAWIRDGMRLFSWAIPGECRGFTRAEHDDAVAWAANGSSGG
ncbi:MAG: STAS/SEC14 domain-containing protein [Actinomycetota bacterium]|nr:MAG: STAS/SEC14 domain-containing protein [Actinomycetota bacterium]